MKHVASAVGAALLLSAAAGSAHAALMYKDIVNPSDLTFNQELGINNAGLIAGYFGSGGIGHPNKGYTTVPPYTSFSNENFPGSVQTQVTGLNNIGTTVGFWSDTNLGGGDNNFGFVHQGGTFTGVNNPNTGSAPQSTSCSVSTTVMWQSASIPMRRVLPTAIHTISGQ